MRWFASVPLFFAGWKRHFLLTLLLPCVFILPFHLTNAQSGAMTGGASVSSGNSDRWEEREGELLRKKKGTFFVCCKILWSDMYVFAAPYEECAWVMGSFRAFFFLAWSTILSFLACIYGMKSHPPNNISNQPFVFSLSFLIHSRIGGPVVHHQHRHSPRHSIRPGVSHSLSDQQDPVEQHRPDRSDRKATISPAAEGMFPAVNLLFSTMFFVLWDGDQ